MTRRCTTAVKQSSNTIVTYNTYNIPRSTTAIVRYFDAIPPPPLLDATTATAVDGPLLCHSNTKREKIGICLYVSYLKLPATRNYGEFEKKNNGVSDKLPKHARKGDENLKHLKTFYETLKITKTCLPSRAVRPVIIAAAAAAAQP